MDEILDKYKHKDHFFLSRDTSLKKVCNAPKNQVGVYYVYKLAHGKVRLVYIGASGKMQKNGKFKTQNSSLWNGIVKGKEFETIDFTEKVKENGIEAIDVYWYVTFDENHQDIPTFIQGNLLQNYFKLFGCFPEWNLEF